MLDELRSDLRYRLRALFRRDAMEAELDQELGFHLEREIEKHMRAGLSRAAAERRARLEFGGIARVKDDSRDARGVSVLENIARDVRYALRGVRARPLFSGVVVLTLAVGVGVNTAMFGIIDRLLLRPPAYLIDPASVHRVYLQSTAIDGRRVTDNATEYKRVLDLARWNHTLSAVAAFTYLTMPVGTGVDARQLRVAIVDASFFDFFSAHPVLGRFFGAVEDRLPAGERVVVLSYDYWRSQYGASRDVLGKQVLIGTDLYTVIGVAPAGFDGISEQRAPVAFVPSVAFGATRDASFFRNYGWSWTELLVRVKPGVSLDRATADLTHAFALSWQAERVMEPSLSAVSLAKPTVELGPPQLAAGPMAGPQAKVIRWIGGVAFIVLLIACANVANLLLARALGRRREVAVRRAMGGSRARLIQQLLVETLVLCLLSAGAGLAGAQLVGSGLRRLLLADVDAQPIASDARTIVFATLLALIATLMAALVPVLRVGRDDLAESLRAGMREGAYRRSRARSALLVGQTALSLVLLVGAALFVQSLRAVHAQPLGYDLGHLVYVETTLRGLKLTDAESRALTDRLLAETRSVPGVRSASAVVSVPFWFDESRALHVDGIDSVKKLGRFALQAGSPDYFATTGTRILRGRSFTDADRAGMPLVAVVSDAMARVLWAGEDPLGKCIHIGSANSPCTTVVGVAENIKTRTVTGPPEYEYYLPMAQYFSRFGQPLMVALFVRTAGAPENSTGALRGTLQRVMPGMSFITARPLHDIVEPEFRSWTAGARMFSTFGLLALVLAAIGLYAAIAFGVAQRTHELGVRIALGARGEDLIRLVVGEGTRITLAGALVGAAIAWFAGRWIQDLLFDVSAHDAAIYGAVTILLLAVGVVASAIPAMRAARVDPNVALRVD
jgi:putative ABC transport system permease protein